MSDFVGMAVNIRLGRFHRRLWYAVKNDSISIREFEEVAKKINQFPEKASELEFLHSVEQYFKNQGYERIAK